VIFLTRSDVVAMHDELLSAFGGEAGFLNETALDSALSAAANRAHYEGADLARCASTYAFHVTKAHAFVDGNKRLGAAAATTFLESNVATLAASENEMHSVILSIAANRMSRDETDAWFAARVRESSGDAAAP
jgi:death-on-curing protein